MTGVTLGPSMLGALTRGGGAPGRRGTTGATFCGAGGGDPGFGPPGRNGLDGGGGGASISSSSSTSGSRSTMPPASSSTAWAPSMPSAGVVGSKSARGSTSAADTSSRSDGTSDSVSASEKVTVGSSPSNTPPSTSATCSSARLVDSISSDVSRSGETSPRRLEVVGGGSGSRGGAGPGCDRRFGLRGRRVKIQEHQARRLPRRRLAVGRLFLGRRWRARSVSAIRGAVHVQLLFQHRAQARHRPATDR